VFFRWLDDNNNIQNSKFKFENQPGQDIPISMYKNRGDAGVSTTRFCAQSLDLLSTFSLLLILSQGFHSWKVGGNEKRTEKVALLETCSGNEQK